MNKTNEEKILDILAGITSRMDSMETGLNARIDSLGSRMDSIDGRMDSMERGLTARMDSIENKIDTMDNRIVKIEFRLETDLDVKMDALAEGHAAILERLVPTSRVDELENRVKVLEAVLSSVTSELQQLRKAQ